MCINYSNFEKKLLYKFDDKSFLENALRHSSFVNEQADDELEDNERLEFLGDAVLNLVTGDLLMRHYPDIKEGDLSRMRANLVNESKLADIARSIDLGDLLKLGKGEAQTGGQDKPSILADAFEALIAAVYLDGGFLKAFQFIETHFKDFLDTIIDKQFNHDSKSKLQEYAQLFHKVTPTYEVVHESGPDHDKTFKVKLNIGYIEALAIGKSKKTAEQNAAKKALKMLKKKKND